MNATPGGGVQSLAPRPLARYAWLAIPLVVVVMAGIWAADPHGAWHCRPLLGLLAYGPAVLAVWFIVIPTARSFVATGQRSVLMLGCGMWVQSLGVAGAALAATRSLDLNWTIYDSSYLLAALCHGVGVAIVSKPRVRPEHTATSLAAAYGGGLAAVGLVAWAAYAGGMPAFHAPGQGGTLMRYLVVSTTVALFLMSAGLLWQAQRRAPSSFLYWYALGLTVIATGLAGSMLIPAADSPLQWVTRTTRAWGTVYLCVAVLAEGRGRGIRQPLLTGLAQVGWQRASALARLDRRTFLAWGLRYGSAVAAVAAGFLVRLALTAWSGPGLPPYLTYYPAVMTVALLAGFGPGLLASVLAGLTAVTWGLDPIGPLVIGASVNRLGLVIFLGMGLCTSVVAEVYRRARNKAAAYDSEVARRESETKYHFLFNNITEEVHFWQLVRFEDGRIQTWRLVDANPPTLKTWGKTADEIRGRTTDEIFGPGATAHYLPVVEKIMREGVPHSFEDYFPNLGKHFKFTSVPLGDYFITTGTDITDIKKIQDDLREADRRKDDFLAMLSHELRNPLAAINNGIYLLDHGVPGSEPARRAQTVIGRQMKQLSRLVDDLLDMTRISRNKIQLQFERMDLVQVARRAIEDHRGPLEANGLRLDFAAPIEAVWVLADAARVTQMLGNLLLNAGKFTDPGGAVTLEIQARGAEAAVIVTDTGIGMDEAMLSRLFQPFAQADRSLDRSRGGLGLGLALTKGMAELHGGALIASSPGLGQGSRFLLTLPAAPPQARGAESPVSARPARRHRVLVIEDNLDAALTLKLLLELSGHEVTTAHTGGEGIAQAKAQRPEVILCDIGLPDTDGYRVARTLREEPEWQPSCLVAMTGYGQPEDKRRALEAGFDHHLTKPADPEALTRLLAF